MTAGGERDAAHRPATLARAVDTVLVLTIAADAAFAVTSGASVDWRATAFLCCWIHVFVGLYDGWFGSWRAVSWMVLTGFQLVAVILLFVSYVSPNFPLIAVFVTAARWIPVLGDLVLMLFAERLIELVGTLPAREASESSAFVLLGLLAIDVVSMALGAARWRRSSVARAALLSVAAVLAGGALGTVSGFGPQRLAPAGSPIDILPAWYVLPLYAVLRTVPDKTAGMALAFAVVAVPLAWPWMRAWAARLGRYRVGYRIAFAVLAASWIGLGVSGAYAPTEDVLLGSRLATAGVLLVLTVIVPLLVRLSEPVRPAPTGPSPA